MGKLTKADLLSCNWKRFLARDSVEFSFPNYIGHSYVLVRNLREESDPTSFYDGF